MSFNERGSLQRRIDEIGHHGLKAAVEKFVNNHPYPQGLIVTYRPPQTDVGGLQGEHYASVISRGTDSASPANIERTIQKLGLDPRIQVRVGFQVQDLKNGKPPHYVVDARFRATE